MRHLIRAKKEQTANKKRKKRYQNPVPNVPMSNRQRSVIALLVDLKQNTFQKLKQKKVNSWKSLQIKSRMRWTGPQALNLFSMRNYSATRSLKDTSRDGLIMHIGKDLELDLPPSQRQFRQV